MIKIGVWKMSVREDPMKYNITLNKGKYMSQGFLELDSYKWLKVRMPLLVPSVPTVLSFICLFKITQLDIYIYSAN